LAKFNVIDLRTKLLVEPQLQKKIIWNFFFLGMTITMINLISFYFLVGKIVDQFSGLNQLNPAVLEVIQQTCLYLIVSSLIMSILVMIGFCIYGLYFSNRVAGPIYNLRKALGRILEGDKTVRIKFRKDDYFQELSEQVNLVLEKQAASPGQTSETV
jgi:methyl-accepting chemotaxis protein